MKGVKNFLLLLLLSLLFTVIFIAVIIMHAKDYTGD